MKLALLSYGVLLSLTISQIQADPLIFASVERCDSGSEFMQGCSDDCTSLRLCIMNQIIEINCEIQSGGTKNYCSSLTNTCQEDPIDCENGTSSKPEFKCPEIDGFYPHPLDCTKFYECHENQTYASDCAPGTRFNPKIPGCKKGIVCYTFSPEDGLCKKKIGKYVLHPLDKNVYAKCEEFPVVLKCPSDNIFDLKKEACQYDCKIRGTYPDRDDKQFYYVCEKTGLVWTPRHEKCPDGMVYDDAFKGCRRDA